MGNRKLRLSSIIPNGWLYKLKEMRITPKSTQTQTLPPDEDSVQVQPPHRKSYHLSRKRIPTTKKTPNSTPTPSSATKSSSSSSSVSAACSCGSTSTTATIQSTLRSKPISSALQESASFDQMLAWSSTSCNCSSNSPLPDGDDDDYVRPRVGLPPIRTEHKKFSDLVREIGQVEEELLLVDNQIKLRQDHVISRSPARRRLRINSPKLSRRVENNAGRKSVRRKKRIEKESVAMVKSSSDPERDFRESMMEMIVENEIREAKELEELLACYLSLNSMEYHHLIVHVFQQIWFDLNHITR